MSNRHHTCMCPTLFLIQYNMWHCCTTKLSQCILHTFCMTQKNATKNQCFFKKKERDYMVVFPNRKQLIQTLSFFELLLIKIELLRKNIQQLSGGVWCQRKASKRIKGSAAVLLLWPNLVVDILTQTNQTPTQCPVARGHLTHFKVLGSQTFAEPWATSFNWCPAATTHRAAD